jgi:endonuclease/exonuclease/phosphatase (EEP) superfamily protein YafD
MDLPRTRRFGTWLWRHLHRTTESYWWLAPVLLGWLGLLAAAVGVLCHELTLSWQPAIVLAALAHQLMWGALLAFVVFVAARRWLALFLAMVVLSGVVATQAGLYVADGKPASGAALTVLQANLRIGNANPAHIVGLVREDDVDVATTEELTVEERHALIAAGLSKQLPYYFGYVEPVPQGDKGLAIWSRYPLTVKVEHPGYQLGVLSARMVTPIGALTLFAVHLRAPYPYPSAEWVRELASLKNLLATAATDGQSVIVAGDFNSTVDNAQFRHLLTNGYGDVAEDLGSGYLPTYPSDRWYPPLVAIDHVLTANVGAVHLATVALPGSDHRGLLATFAP